MELKDLCGMHELSGVDTGAYTDLDFHGYNCYANYIRFRLDGVTYEAVEDPDDGYRSYMGEIKETHEKIRNTFPPVKVNCVMDKEPNDILIMRDDLNGKEILYVGTNYEDDYYPICTFIWMPENMACNEVTHKVLYLCDRKACGGKCNEECRHTKDINHAVNFEADEIYDGVGITYHVEKEHK